MKKEEKRVWDRFWEKRQVEEIYPPVTDIFEELKMVTKFDKKRILEVGAGTGRDGMRMSKYGADVYLLDYSIKSLNLIKTYLKREGKSKTSVSLIMADARWTPFRDKTFDIVFHQGLLEHFFLPTELLKENHRILKDDGLLLVDVPQTFHIYTILKHILIFFGLWFGGWERQFTINSLNRLLKRNHFQGFYFYGDWSRPGILYKIIREILARFRIKLPMYPKYFSPLTEKFYRLQKKLKRKKAFLWTTLSIGIIARKMID